MNKSIHESTEICNRLREYNLMGTLSEYALGYIISILITAFSCGYRGKTVDIARNSDRHRTSISRFLRYEDWDDSALEETMRKLVIDIIYEESRKSGMPILFIVDDTISSKTIPSSKASHPIEAASFHFSHLKKKQDYGHQAVSVMLSCNGITLNYAIVMYDKSVSKINIVKQLAQNLPSAPNPSYLLCDSWYVCGKLMDAFATKGFYTVGALKSNRILYPCGVKMNVCEFARTLSHIALFHIVTVKGRKYYVYRYEGRLNNIENAVVLICYPVSAFAQEKALRTFICTNADLASDEEILNLYAVRWEIEVYFRDCKNKLAFDKYQIRSANGIKRFWLISSLAYLLACLESPSFNFSEGYASISQTIFIERVSFIFDFAQSGGEKSALLAMVA